MKIVSKLFWYQLWDRRVAETLIKSKYCSSCR